ncbi:hypothetical protein COO20_09855 [Thalassospira marina]|uniref:Uncharacterized protein n=2 Tax=Thalassospira marina TaxID=2048283 RepID=A0A2N3KV47_9PROT|nr:hypothetical protein COO20_09855 [Thalassospira marina]
MGHLAPPYHEFSYTIKPITVDELVISGFRGNTLGHCKSLAIAQAIAAHEIMDALTACGNRLQDPDERDVSATIRKISCITDSIEQDAGYVASNACYIDGTVRVQTTYCGTINFEIANALVDQSNIHEQPSKFIITEVARRLTQAIGKIGQECHHLQNEIDGHEAEIRQISPAQDLPQSVRARIQ